MYWNYREEIFLGPQAVSFVERLSLFQSIQCQRFHYIVPFYKLYHYNAICAIPFPLYSVGGCLVLSKRVAGYT